jgi:hypothetical protein
MGFTKWLFKNGPGSIGSTAKTWSKVYLDALSNDRSIDAKKVAFAHTFMLYTVANQRVRKYKASDIEDVIKNSNMCLALFIFILICEIPSLYDQITSNKETQDLSFEVVYECVQEIAPSQIGGNFDSFKYSAQSFLMWTTYHRR